MPQASSKSQSCGIKQLVPRLNEDVLRRVLSFANEGTLWRGRRVSRWMKRIADAELKPFLRSKRVQTSSAAKINIYDHLDDSWRDKGGGGEDRHGWGWEQHPHRGQLKRRHARFERHIAAFPPSASTLRKLSLELRDDLSSGWPLLAKFAAQLQSLRLVVHDELEWWYWEDCDRGDDYWDAYEGSDGGASHMSAETVGSSAPAMMNWSQKLHHRVRFTHVTSLTLIATARITDHFIGAAKHFPHLHELTLHCPFHDQYDLRDRDQPKCRQTFPLLKRLVVTGSVSVAVHALAVLLGCFPKLQSLVLAVDTDGFATDSDRAARALVRLPHLEKLAVYGCVAGTILGAIASVQVYSPGQIGFQRLKTLALEKVKDVNGPEDRAFPLLAMKGDRSSAAPRFPVLDTLIFVDRRKKLAWSKGKQREVSLGPSTAVGFGDYFYEASHLQGLFERYTSLEHAYWTRRYPVDLLAITNDTQNWAEHCVMCGVRRYSGDKTLSNQFVQYIPIKIGRSPGMLKARRMVPVDAGGR